MIISALIKQKSYEKIEYFLRQHPITFVPTVLLFLVLMLIPVGVYFLITGIFPNILSNQILYALGVLLGSIYYLSLNLFFYAQFVEFYLDLWIVTNDRMIDIEQLGLFSRSITEADLYRIQDVTVDVKGLLPTLLKYGNVTVKTASGNQHIVFRNIPHPNEIRQALIQLCDQDRKYHNEN